METVKKLLDSTRDKKLGNHRLEVQPDGTKHYIYFWTVICKENPYTKTFSIDDTYGTRSTSIACSSYRNELTKAGYTEVKDIH